MEYKVEDSLLLSVDSANIDQFGEFKNLITNQNIPFIPIDHHDTTELQNYSDIQLFDPEASSTCILITNLF